MIAIARRPHCALPISRKIAAGNCSAISFAMPKFPTGTWWMKKCPDAEVLLTIVDFHQSDATRVIFTAHDCGISAGGEIRGDGRFAIVGRFQAGILDFRLL